MAAAARAHILGIAEGAGLASPSIEIETLPRGGLSACASDLQIEALDTSHLSRMRYAARCEGSPASGEFIVRATISAEVVVAASDIKANQPIDMAQLDVARREVVLGNVTSDPARVVGKSSRRMLRRGQIVDRRWLIEPVVIERGDAVTIVARNIGVEVHVHAEAQQDGRIDDIIRVRNKANGKIISARVVSAGMVEAVSAR